MGEYSSLALDGSDRPHISYYGNGPLKYAFYDGVSWNRMIADDDVVDAIYTSISLDGMERPHISYYDPAGIPGFSGLKYAYLDEAAWITTRVDTTFNTGWYSSLAIDSMNQPSIAYFDWTNLDLKYAHRVIQNLELEGSHVDGNMLLTWNAHPDAAAYWIFGAENEPHFDVGTAPGYQNRLDVLPSDILTWGSPAGIGDSDRNWSYLVMAVDSESMELDRSNRTGELDFSLIISGR